MQRIKTVFFFLTGLIAGAALLWLAAQSNAVLGGWLLQQWLGSTPQREVARFVAAVAAQNGQEAAARWEVDDNNAADSELRQRHEAVITRLLADHISPDYLILDTEW